MHNSIAEWLRSLPSPLESEMEQAIAVARSYFTENSSFFRDCGFYVVGSSLQRPDFDDIDLVLVGLDFREVFSYTEGFLDTDKLPEIDPALMFDPEADKSHYCIYEIKSQPHLSELVKRIITTLPQYKSDQLFDYSPFNGAPYVHDSLGEWLVSRAELYKGKWKWNDGRIGPKIDLMFHAENLLVSAWKEWQEREELPYLPILELYDPATDNIKKRKSFDLCLPDFVDAEGKVHMKMKYHRNGHGKLKKPLY